MKAIFKYTTIKSKTILEQEISIEKSKYDCSVTFIVDFNERTGKSKQKQAANKSSAP